ncbi:LysM domain-containing protein [Bacillus sp. FJAT-49736]|uniref:LysM peptidoglycan-binding domain-containing protein n=1 Tax=Bacillus sp. FJAT-49736 TaxID=2833582 RepID=UPI001BCA4E4B|nr:LysM domain-containing protein [Bacillus sp. FJAT-49736]MBS4173550.1 LysM peptidoglycan-binding domain-containing protein [Bacillus sp. FJAT-49736]
MKRFLAFVAAIIILYSVYYDIKVGTIPSVSHASEIKSNSVHTSDIIPNQIHKVNPGDTVLSIVEHLQNGHFTVSMEKIISDFQKLNNGIKPEEIQIGQEYKFPIYKNK